ncbi:hypothetical protein J6590_108379 [Homalodisca vitripennis]|nr:hypothetical protein J6590_108379 [Homalodisca vitripennis]
MGCTPTAFETTVTILLSFHLAIIKFSSHTFSYSKVPLSFFFKSLLSVSGHFAILFSLTVPIALIFFWDSFSNKGRPEKKLSKYKKYGKSPFFFRTSQYCKTTLAPRPKCSY